MKEYTRELLESELRELEIPENKIEHALKWWDDAPKRVNEWWNLKQCRDIVISHPTDHEGEVKYCSSCNKIRKTTCCACGCGNCKTCGKMWTCMPVDFKQNSFIPSGFIIGDTGNLFGTFYNPYGVGNYGT